MSTSLTQSPPKDTQTMEIPILRVPFDAEDRHFLNEGLKEILDTGNLTMGRFTKAFESEFAAFCGVSHAVAASNCTTALEIILRSVGVEGKTVIVPANTFIATAFAAVHAGAKVVFADCDPRTLSLDPQDVKRRLRPDTAAVILVHIGGIISPAVEELKALCDLRGISLIEDCAHAHGSSYKGVKAGAWGRAGAFSFFPTKPLVSGEGGLITTSDAALYEQAMMLRNHGKNPKLKNRISELGHNWRMNEVTALMALQQTRKAPALFASRKTAAKFYDEKLKSLKRVKSLVLPAGLDSTYYKYVLWLEDGVSRDALKKTLKEEHKVSLTGEVYDLPCHREPVWEKHSAAALNAGETLAGCEEIAARHVCLPLYPGMTPGELAHVTNSLETVLAKLSK